MHTCLCIDRYRKKSNVMTNEQLQGFYQRYIDAANARDFDTIADLIHDEVTIGGAPYTRDDVLGALKGIVAAVPDFVWHVEDLFTQDGRIAARLRDTGTPGQNFLGLDPTGASVEFTEFASYKIVDGRFSEMWFLMDQQAVASQLSAAR